MDPSYWLWSRLMYRVSAPVRLVARALPPPTVRAMSNRTQHPKVDSPLAGLELGDVVTLPDGRSLSIRALAAFSEPQMTVGGFVILGECESMLTTPSRQGLPHLEYLPVGTLSAAKGARVMLEGVASYWAPHLPSYVDAMGELPFRLLEVPGHSDPWILVYRGPEVLVFMRSRESDLGQLGVLHMPRRVGADEVQIRRHAATIMPSYVPAPSQIPARQPVAEPLRQPEHEPVR